MPLVHRGLIPSPRHILARAVPHVVTTTAPPQFFWKPIQLSMWGNNVDGDCVTAEEAFKTACIPGIFIPDATVVAWASSHGFLNGAFLPDVMSAMQKDGFVQSGTIYDDGPDNSVDWTNPEILQNAISIAPVKIGIAADQLENTYQAHPNSGWFATGYTSDSAEDHCVSLNAYGPLSYLFRQLGVPVPDGVDGTQPGYGLFTWSSVGVIDIPSLLAITAEAWLRNPATIVKTQ